MQRDEALAALRALAEGLSRPVWLFGGLAVDFTVGRWTRSHGDIDLNAYDDDWPVLASELRRLGFDSSDSGWLTHWALPAKAWRLEVVFLERTEPNSGTLVIAETDHVGRPGRYPLPPHHLTPERYGSLNGVRFRVSSPEGEWLARVRQDVILGRARDRRRDHDLRLLEEFLGAEVIATLRQQAGDRPG